MHFRCRVWHWQAQILDVIRCHLLLKHPCDVDKIRPENANLLKSSVVFLSFTTEIAVCIICCLSHFELVNGNNVFAL